MITLLRFFAMLIIDYYFVITLRRHSLIAMPIAAFSCHAALLMLFTLRLMLPLRYAAAAVFAYVYA